MIGPRLNPRMVYIARAPEPSYKDCEAVKTPELPQGVARTSAEIGLRALFVEARLDIGRLGTQEWNPLADLVGPGEKVLVKPNWVSHRNLAGRGVDCLVTHSSVIRAVLVYLAKAKPRGVVLGDAPVQGCDFLALRAAGGIDHATAPIAANFNDFCIRDFRNSRLEDGRFWGHRQRTDRSQSETVVFDLGGHSLLEPISERYRDFRVTMYDPQVMQEWHRPGRHRYILAREAVDADVVINLPKLKTHKKAGVTGSLKNLVGVCASKDCLPHHRKGHVRDGGDCYRDPSRLKGWAEELLDRGNSAGNTAAKYALAKAAALARRAAMFRGQDGDIEGSWYGNDTVWRMGLDIQRLVHYGCADGTLSREVQRRVITITDAIVAGEGDGPLASSPVPLGILTLATNVAAAEWVHAHLMGFAPSRVPIIKEAFGRFEFGIADFPPSEVCAVASGETLSPVHVGREFGAAFRPPVGWLGHCEHTSDRR